MTALNAASSFSIPNSPAARNFTSNFMPMDRTTMPPIVRKTDATFAFAIRQGYRTILDLGCGSGFALDAAKRAGLETYGIELSHTAATAAAQRGHIIFPVLLEDMDPVWEGKFDLISLNQLLEHVPDPAGLIRQCIRFLSPRGAICHCRAGRNRGVAIHSLVGSQLAAASSVAMEDKRLLPPCERTSLRVIKPAATSSGELSCK